MKANLETGIDEFVEEIRKRGKITFSQATQIFGISEEQVEEWAKLLAEHKEEVGIEVHYPTFGEPEIVATAIKKSAEMKGKIESLQKNAGDLENILEKYSEKGEKKEKAQSAKPKAEASKAEKSSGGFEKIKGFFEKKASKGPEITNDLHELEQDLGKAKQVEQTLDQLSSEAKRIEERMRGAQNEEKKIILESQSVQKTLSELKGSVDALIPNVQKKMHRLESVKLDPRLVKEIRANIAKINSDVAEIEGYAKKFETTGAKEKLAILLKKVSAEGEKLKVQAKPVKMKKTHAKKARYHTRHEKAKKTGKKKHRR